MLAKLIYLCFAEYDDGEYIFRFKNHGIPTTTFNLAVPEDKVGAALEEADESPVPRLRAKKKKSTADPRIGERWEWPAYYHAHKADFDALWASAMHYSFALESPSQLVEGEDEDVPEVPVISE